MFKISKPLKNNKNYETYWILGKHPVYSAIRNKERIINKIIVSNLKNKFFLNQIQKELNLYNKKVKIQVEDIKSFKRIFSSQIHQGIAANVKKLNNLHLNDFLSKTENDEKVFSVFLYKIQDPHNLGAIIRSAVAFNFKYVLLNKKNSSKENNTVAKVSSGGIDNIKLVNTINMNSTFKKLKENGWLIIGLDAKAKININELDNNIFFSKKIMIILGSESKGLGNNISKFFDFHINIPINKNNIDCLNVSNAAAIMFFHINKLLPN